MAYNQFPEHPDDSVGGWMLTFFLMGIPLVGFVYLLVLALGSGGSPAKRNFARAAFLWQIICALLAVLFFVLFGAAFLWWPPDPSFYGLGAGLGWWGGGHPIPGGAPPTLLATRTTL